MRIRQKIKEWGHRQTVRGFGGRTTIGYYIRWAMRWWLKHYRIPRGLSSYSKCCECGRRACWGFPSISIVGVMSEEVFGVYCRKHWRRERKKRPCRTYYSKPIPIDVVEYKHEAWKYRQAYEESQIALLAVDVYKEMTGPNRAEYMKYMKPKGPFLPH